MRRKHLTVLMVLMLGMTLVLTACGGGGGGGTTPAGGETDYYTIGVTVSGIAGSVVLQNNGADDLTIDADGSFTFATPVADSGGYLVTVLSSIGQACTLTNSGGTIGGADVTDVTLSCTPVSVLVSALYPTNGADWNDYVKNNGADEFSATGTACDPATDGPGYSACLHGGEMRVVEATGMTSCAGLTASDALGAFDWACDDSTGTARFISTGLKDGMNLSDLLDFTAPGWKDNSVAVRDGGAVYTTTAPAAWWSNLVAVDNDGGYLDAAGTIYVVTFGNLATSGTGYIINAPSIGLVAQPGQIINGPGTGSGVIYADGSANARDFFWLEGEVDATGDNYGIGMSSVRFSVLRDVKANNASVDGIFISSSSNNKLNGVTATENSSNGIQLRGFNNNTLSGITVSSNGSGIHFVSSSGNLLSEAKTSNNESSGVVIDGSSNNTLKRLTSSNNGSAGLEIGGILHCLPWGQCSIVEQSTNNLVTGVTVSNNFWGVYMLQHSSDNTLSGVTASNNSTGIFLSNVSDNTLSGVTASNNSYGVQVQLSSDNVFPGVSASNNNTNGVHLDSSSNNTFSGVAASNNGNYGVYLTESLDNYFTESLKVGNNVGGDCYITNSIAVPTLTAPGLDDDADPSDVETDTIHSGLCTQEGASDFGTAVTGVTLASSFVGKVSINDSANASDSNGSALYPADPATFDWINFENSFRVWGKDGSDFPDTDHRDRWSSGTGRIWDWSLTQGDTGDAGSPAILGVLTLPTGNNTLTHTWSDASTITFLRNAVEIQDDDVGNDNTLCESGETCLYTPNIGSYQGHGSLISTGTFTDGVITGVTLMQYETNGR